MVDHEGKGNDQAQASRNIFEELNYMGNETITSAESSVLAKITTCFESMNKSIKGLQTEIRTIKRANSQEHDDHMPLEKQMRLDKQASNCDDDIAHYLSDDSMGEVSQGDENEWEDITSFLDEDKEQGEAVPEQLALLANKSLRCKSIDEKLKELRNKHKRPENVENLQVTKVDDILWGQLRPETKAFDYNQQKMQSVLSQALVPVIKLMQIVKKEGNKETRELVADTFKILTQGIVISNENRREKIKKNLLPNYRKLCDNPPSATKLFGDKLEEDIKKMKESKTKLTPFLQPQNKHFLSKRGGGSRPLYQNRSYPSQNKQNFRNNNSYNNNNNNNNNQWRRHNPKINKQIQN